MVSSTKLFNFTMGLAQSKLEYSLFIYRALTIIIYVGDLLVTGTDTETISPLAKYLRL